MPYLSQNYVIFAMFISCAHGIQDEYDTGKPRHVSDVAADQIEKKKQELSCFEERRDIVQRCTLITLNCNENKEFLLSCPIEHSTLDLEQIEEPYENRK